MQCANGCLLQAIPLNIMLERILQHPQFRNCFVPRLRGIHCVGCGDLQALYSLYKFVHPLQIFLALFILDRQPSAVLLHVHPLLLQPMPALNKRFQLKPLPPRNLLALRILSRLTTRRRHQPSRRTQQLPLPARRIHNTAQHPRRDLQPRRRRRNISHSPKLRLPLAHPRAHTTSRRARPTRTTITALHLLLSFAPLLLLILTTILILLAPQLSFPLLLLLILRRALADTAHTRSLRAQFHLDRIDHSCSVGSQTLAFFVAHLGHHLLRERHLAAAGAAHFGRFVRAVVLVRGFALCA